MPQNSSESEISQNCLEQNPICANRKWLLTCAVVVFEINQIRHGNTQQRYFFHRNTIYRSVIIKVNLEVLRSWHIMKMEFRSRYCLFVRHEKRTDKLSVRQQSIYCVKNARNALSRKHWTLCQSWSGSKLFAKVISRWQKSLVKF